MSTSAEKLVKQTIKLISKTQDLEYEELKIDAKKLIKAARVYDETLLGMMEEMMDISNVSSPEELEDFNVEVLKIYCRIKELDDSGSDRSIRHRVWENMELEFEVDDSDEDSDDEPDVEEVDDESEQEPEPVPEPVKVKSRKPKAEKEVVIIG
jgi:hypothetical protein